MKRLLTLSLVLPMFALATTGVSVVENAQKKWDVYYASPSGKEFFIYEDANKLDNTSGSGQPLFYQTRGDIFSIFYTCIGDYQDSCIRYVDNKTNQISSPIENPALMVQGNYSTLIGPIDNLDQKVVLIFDYPQDDQYTIVPIFKPCQHPFVYQVPGGSIGPNVGSQFLSDGSLRLNMIMTPNAPSPYKSVVIPINYKKLYQDCQSNS